MASVRQELVEIQARARRPATEDVEASVVGDTARSMGEQGTAPSTLRSTRGIPKSQVRQLVYGWRAGVSGCAERPGPR